MDNELNIAFFGTDEASTIVLDTLSGAGFTPNLVVASPDKPVGRKKELQTQPTKVWAEKNDVTVIQPKNFKEIPPELTNPPAGGWDIFIVVYYPKILPKKVFDIPKYGALNVHPSLLPKLRGPSPIKTAILEDMRETGATIILLDEKMDHGPILAQAHIEFEKEDWPPTGTVLRSLLTDVGAELLIETLPDWLNGDIDPEEQDHEEATISEKIIKEDGEISLDDDPYQNFLKIKAFDEWPGTYFFVSLPAGKARKGGKDIRIKITDAIFKNGKLIISRIIPEGKREMSYEDFKRSL